MDERIYSYPHAAQLRNKGNVVAHADQFSPETYRLLLTTSPTTESLNYERICPILESKHNAFNKSPIISRRCCYLLPSTWHAASTGIGLVNFVYIRNHKMLLLPSFGNKCAAYVQHSTIVHNRPKILSSPIRCHCQND